MGEVVRDPKKGSPLPEFSLSWGFYLIFPIYLVGTYWILAFWNNFCDFITAGSAVNYYFEKNNVFVPAFATAIFYHIGTIIFGSLILFPATFLQMTIGWFHSMFRAENPNAAQKIIGKICCCLWNPYEKFVLRIDEGVFTMTYLTSLDFCPSSKNVYYLKKRHQEIIGNASLACMVYSWTARIAIAFITAILSYLVFSKIDYFAQRVNKPISAAVVRINLLGCVYCCCYGEQCFDEFVHDCL